MPDAQYSHNERLGCGVLNNRVNEPVNGSARSEPELANVVVKAPILRSVATAVGKYGQGIDCLGQALPPPLSKPRIAHKQELEDIVDIRFRRFGQPYLIGCHDSVAGY